MREDGEEVVEAGLVAERGSQGGWGGEELGVVKGEADLAVERKVVEGVGWVAVAMGAGGAVAVVKGMGWVAMVTVAEGSVVVAMGVG